MTGASNATRPLGALVTRALLAAAAVILLAAGGLSCGGTGGQSAQGGATAPLTGLCFSPYTQGSPASDAPAGTVDNLLGIVSPYANSIRTFGSTGSGSQTATSAKALGLQVAAGADLETDQARNDLQVAGVVKLASSGYADLAVIGEESLFFNFVSEQQLVNYINEVKRTGVPTTTSETWGELIGHPRVVAACDLLIANMFPYWENQDISKSIKYLESSYNKTKAAAGGKEVIIETGWPSAGATHGAAVANPANAAYYLKAFTTWARSHKVRYFYFEAFDEPWKVAPEGEVGGHWGIWDANGQMKPGMAASFGKR